MIEGAGGVSDIEGDVKSLRDISTGALTSSVDMFPSNEIEDRKEIPNGLKEIGDLSINGDCIIEIEEIIAYLENQEAISGRNRSVNIGKEIEEKENGLK